ncbi:long-chain fatty acid transport protein 6 [Pimephales promelas]|uniref:long-chain fatty acid transport protein 6 n=1 Tax=Pimephales promelas TaxID=90988 RepID=UPI0019554F4A|nr:long-chain fatty acid transport protein 6 [Pimephales promelas]KAG1930723.1 long-chain fatty acid transport protein [Pimephales promelas]
MLSWIAALLTGILSAHLAQRLCFPYFWKDALYLMKVIRYGARLEIYKRSSRVVTVVDRFVQQAQRIPQKAFVVYEGVTYTYGELEARSNRIARVFQDAVRTGDTVALLMSNEPDFIAVWFGFCKLGCAVAFLNTNIKTRSLLHCLNCCGAKLLVVGADLLGSLEEILPGLREGGVSVWGLSAASAHPDVHSLLDQMESASHEPVPAERRSVTCLKTPTLYIFTSGTTGLPKAAVITHLQSLKAAAGFWAYGGTGCDVIYTPLPLYHSAASLVGIGGTIELGATCVLKKKFSASQFWNDCRKHNVTIFQYIGELCRYLCNQPVAENEKDHKVLMGVGNGLRQDVWREFLRRFGEIRMCEIYGSTEGNLCFMNHLGKVGAVGRSNFFYKLIFKYDLVKYDLIRDEPVRDHNGFCQHVQKGETGLLLSKICSQSPFFGYAGNKQLTEKKILRNVFVKGDAYFNTGDLMAEDEDNFICFKDRVGDTFRWKGENVATTEVTEILGLVDFIQEVNVYGVQVPGNEGRAGMAAVIVKPECTFDREKLFNFVLKELPSYARPLFIRLQESMEMTSTFKQQKFGLVESGFNPSTITDPLFFLDYTEKSYIPLTSSVYDSILNAQKKV